MKLETVGMRLRRARTVNATDNGYPSKVPTATEPAESQGTNAAQATSAAVINTNNAIRSDGDTQNLVQIIPFGAGSDTNTFSFRAIAWYLLSEGAAQQNGTEVWIPVPLAEFQCTMSTPVGVAGKLVVATDRFCDTITLTGTTANSTEVLITSPANDTIGHVVLDMKGAAKLELIFTTGGSATSCNALVRMY